MTAATPPGTPRVDPRRADSSPFMRFWTAWDSFWFAPQPALALTLLRVIAFGTLLAYVAWEYTWVVRLQDVATWLYRPVLLYELLGIGPIPPGLASVLRLVLLACGVLGLLGIWTRLSAGIAAAVYFYSIGQVYSYTNVHHGDYLLGLALVTLAVTSTPSPLAVRVPWPRRAGGPIGVGDMVPVWPIQLVRVQIAVTYFLAGYAKLVVAGPGWGDGVSLQHYLLLRGQPMGYWIASQPLLCAVLSIATLVFEVGFPLALFERRLRWLLVVSAVGFHLVSEYVLGVGFNFFLPFLLVFVDPLAVLRWLGSQRARLVGAPRLLGAR